ncbi:hypothetical protein VV867_20155 [Pseudomonas sp. JH-2]|uniref:hypothetical protein n=1 Tax=Pseudomonas sp. JH-2 TaxID=3114998 RepID=UPI002E273F84|nr:hypothetical protein [Pseudomonas sp. JH-2]
MKRCSPLLLATFIALSGCGKSNGEKVFENVNLGNFTQRGSAMIAEIEPQDKAKAHQLGGALIAVQSYEKFAYQALAGSRYELKSSDEIYAREDKIVNGRTVDEVIEIGKLVFAEAQTADANRINRLDRRVKLLQQLQDNLRIDFSNVRTAFEYRKGAGGQGVMKLDYTAKNNSTLKIRGFVAQLQFNRKDTGQPVYRFTVPVKVDAGEFGPGQTLEQSYRISTQTSFLRLKFLDEISPDNLQATLVPTFVSESVNYKDEMMYYMPLNESETTYMNSFNYAADAFGAKRIGAL